MPIGLLFTAYLLSATPSAPVLGCADLPRLLESFERIHYAGRRVRNVAAERTVEEFIKRIDPSRTLLLASEVEALRKELPAVFKSIKFGSCAVLTQASKLAIKRVEEDEKFVRKLLSGRRFKLDRSVELVLDPEKRGYPKTAAERRDIVSKMVQFQVANYLIAGNDLETAKKRLIHRYELATKRQQEYLSDSELPSLYAEAYAGSLDPHSTFFTARSLEDFQIHMRLSLEGIGAVLRSEDGFTVIQSLVPGGQAEKQGQLRPQDKIMAVAQDGEDPVDVIDMALRDVVELIRGKKGTKVTLTVLREGKTTNSFPVTIVRDQIDVKEQAAKITYETRAPVCEQGENAKPKNANDEFLCRKLGGRPIKVAVIDLPSFYGGDEHGRSSYRDVKQLLEEAAKNHVDGVVLDLSKNGGGLLKDAVEISGLFVRSGPIVATKSFDGEVEVLEDDDDVVDYAGPVVVLTSPLSASGAEILAGALKDYGRAVIVGGDHTFGKGTVQVLNTLPGGVGAIKVTTGMFFLPSGASTQQRGVLSDVRVPSIFNRSDIGEKELEYSLPPESIPTFATDSVEGENGASRWVRLEPGMLKVLKDRSAKRVAGNATLQKIEEELREESRKRGVVRVGEMLNKARDAKKAKDEAGAAKGKVAAPAGVGADLDGEGASDGENKEEVEAMDKAFLEEGTSVLVDLVALVRERSGTVSSAATVR
ncbi:MAG: PDZ domain-containing protein [Deltaproteobacteria bacterium]|nr:PDZ domain-containing protein [Deltaproteobacteria bacterium]